MQFKKNAKLTIGKLCETSTTTSSYSIRENDNMLIAVPQWTGYSYTACCDSCSSHPACSLSVPPSVIVILSIRRGYGLDLNVPSRQQPPLVSHQKAVPSKSHWRKWHVVDKKRG